MVAKQTYVGVMCESAGRRPLFETEMSRASDKWSGAGAERAGIPIAIWGEGLRMQFQIPFCWVLQAVARCSVWSANSWRQVELAHTNAASPCFMHWRFDLVQGDAKRSGVSNSELSVRHS